MCDSAGDQSLRRFGFFCAIAAVYSREMNKIMRSKFTLPARLDFICIMRLTVTVSAPLDRLVQLRPFMALK